MDTPANYLDALKDRLGLDSDNALVPHLKVSRQTLSRYRLGKSALDDDVCITAAQVLGIDPGIVLLHMTAFRTRDPDARRTWLDVARRFFQVVPPELDRRRAPR